MSYGPELQPFQENNSPQNFGEKDFDALWNGSQPVDKLQEPESSHQKFEKLWKESTPLSSEDFEGFSDTELGDAQQAANAALQKAKKEQTGVINKGTEIQSSTEEVEQKTAKFNKENPKYALAGVSNSNTAELDTKTTEEVHETQIVQVGEEVHEKKVDQFARPTINLLDPTGKTPEFHRKELEVDKVAKVDQKGKQKVSESGEVPEIIDETIA